MGLEFFELSPEEQQKSLATFAHELLKSYGISNAKVSCINFGFNATYSVETETGVKYALRININSAKTIKNLLAEIEWVRHLNRTAGINTPTPIATLKDDFIVSAVHPESGLTLFAVMYSWLEGEEIGDEPTLDQLHEVGKAIALLHQDSANYVLSSQLELPTFDDFFWSTEDFLFSEKSKLSPADKSLLQEAHDLVMEFTRDLYETSPVHIIHADVHGWNLMWHEGKLSIFDFDDCGFGVEAQDIAVALYYLDTP